MQFVNVLQFKTWLEYHVKWDNFNLVETCTFKDLYDKFTPRAPDKEVISRILRMIRTSNNFCSPSRYPTWR